MALSNPPASVPASVPAIVEDSPIAQLDDAVIRLRVGDVTYGIPLRDLGALLDAHLPAFVTGQGALGAKEQAMRSGIKALLPMGLRLLASDVESFSRQLEAQGVAPLPLPDLKARHRDLLDYSVRYLAALILSVLSSQPWEAECAETVAGPNGYIRLSGLSGGVTASQASADADSDAAHV